MHGKTRVSGRISFHQSINVGPIGLGTQRVSPGQRRQKWNSEEEEEDLPEAPPACFDLVHVGHPKKRLDDWLLNGISWNINDNDYWLMMIG